MSNVIDLFAEELEIQGYLNDIKDFLDNFKPDIYVPIDKLKKAEITYDHLVKLCQRDLDQIFKKFPIKQNVKSEDWSKAKNANDIFSELCQKEFEISHKSTGCNLKLQGSGMI